jgi:hypothetical protein
MIYEMLVGELPFDCKQVKIYAEQTLMGEALKQLFDIVVKT